MNNDFSRRPANPIATLAQRMAGVQAAPAAPQARVQAAAQTTSAANAAAAPLALLATDLKRRCARKALLGAASSLIPIPLIDLAVDAVLLTQLLTQVNEAFGLAPAQIDALESGKRHRTFAAIQFVGNRVIGKIVTRAIVTTLLKGLGLKLTAQQLSKAVPIAGQIASATLNYAALRMVVNQHIDDCVRVVQRAQNEAA